MPVDLVFFKTPRGRVPVLDWVATLPASAQDAIGAALEVLTVTGYQTPRPTMALLRGGIYELRVKEERINYRILLSFHERHIAVLYHGFIKKTRKVPDADIDKALAAMELFRRDPAAHTAEEGRS